MSDSSDDDDDCQTLMIMMMMMTKTTMITMNVLMTTFTVKNTSRNQVKFIGGLKRVKDKSTNLNK